MLRRYVFNNKKAPKPVASGLIVALKDYSVLNEADGIQTSFGTKLNEVDAIG